MEALSVLIKPTSENCNMSCGYCFYKKESAQRLEENKGFMSLDTLETLVSKAFSEAEKLCAFHFQGGEPTLMDIEFYHRFLEFVDKYNRKQINTIFTIQTNGYNLDDEWIKFLTDNNFLIGISVDGPEEVHDYYRKNFNEGTYKIIMNNIKKIEGYGAEYNILSVITNKLAKYPKEYYKWIKENDFRYVQLTPYIDMTADDDIKYAPNDKEFNEFFQNVFLCWYEDFMKDDYYSISNFDNYVRLSVGMPAESCTYNGMCSPYPVIEADGSFYPCDFYATDKYYVGNIKNHSYFEMLNNPICKSLAEKSSATPAQCSNCNVKGVCRNGCYAYRERKNEFSGAVNGYCQAYKVFFENNMELLKKAAKKAFV